MESPFHVYNKKELKKIKPLKELMRKKRKKILPLK